MKYVWRKRKGHSEKACLYKESEVENENIVSVKALCGKGYHSRMFLYEDLDANKCPECQSIQKIEAKNERK